MSFDDKVISVNDLSKTYRIFRHPGDRLKQAMTLGFKSFYRGFTALDHISFEVRKGETIGVIGRNGSGKSTLLQLLCGILKPTTGSVSTRGRISALLELGAGFSKELTGRENVYFQGILAGLSRSEINARYEEIIAFADIGDFINQPVWTYSSGMAIRLAFAASIYVEPDILIVDEALSVGDAAFQFKCFERMKLLSESGITIIFVSHDTAMVKSFCDRVIYLSEGKLVSEGPADVVVEQYFMDIRRQQTIRNRHDESVSVKAPLAGSAKGISFGTVQGSVARACFQPSGNTGLTLTDTGHVSISVDIEFNPSLSNLYLSVYLQDQRLMTIGGKVFPVHADTVLDNRAYASQQIEFEARLGPGSYFISFRLQSGKGADIQLLDKQAGALSIVVVANDEDFLGMFDIGMKLVNQNRADTDV